MGLLDNPAMQGRQVIIDAKQTCAECGAAIRLFCARCNLTPTMPAHWRLDNDGNPTPVELNSQNLEEVKSTKRKVYFCLRGDPDKTIIATGTIS